VPEKAGYVSLISSHLFQKWMLHCVNWIRHLHPLSHCHAPKCWKCALYDSTTTAHLDPKKNIFAAARHPVTIFRHRRGRARATQRGCVLTSSVGLCEGPQGGRTYTVPLPWLHNLAVPNQSVPQTYCCDEEPHEVVGRHPPVCSASPHQAFPHLTSK
jgi:hypothetical protein